MPAHVFWHRPAEGVGLEAHENGLRAFHAALGGRAAGGLGGLLVPRPDRRAVAARPGAGAVDGHHAGSTAIDGPQARWTAADPGLPAGEAGIWRRRLVLGRAPRDVALGSAPAGEGAPLGRRALLP